MNGLTTTWKFRLKDEVKDTVTGFKGTITARIEYLNGCIQYCVEPKVGKEMKMEKHHWVDEAQLELIKTRSARAKKASEKGTGGVMPNTPD